VVCVPVIGMAWTAYRPGVSIESCLRWGAVIRVLLAFVWLVGCTDAGEALSTWERAISRWTVSLNATAAAIVFDDFRARVAAGSIFRGTRGHWRAEPSPTSRRRPARRHHR